MNQVRVRAQVGEKPLTTLQGPTSPLLVDQERDRLRDGDKDGDPDLIRLRERLRDCLDDMGSTLPWFFWGVWVR